MERRKFMGIGGGVIAGAAVGAVGSRLGSGLATDGQLVAMPASRGLSGDEARGALQAAGPLAEIGSVLVVVLFAIVATIWLTLITRYRASTACHTVQERLAS